MLKRPQNNRQGSGSTQFQPMASSAQTKSAIPSFSSRSAASYSRTSPPTNESQGDLHNLFPHIPGMRQGPSLLSTLRAKAAAAAASAGSTDAANPSTNTAAPTPAPARTRPALSSISFSPSSPSSNHPDGTTRAEHLSSSHIPPSTPRALENRPLSVRVENQVSSASSNGPRSTSPSSSATSPTRRLGQPGSSSLPFNPVPAKDLGSTRRPLDLQLTGPKTSPKRHSTASSAAATSPSQADPDRRRSFNSSLSTPVINAGSSVSSTSHSSSSTATPTATTPAARPLSEPASSTLANTHNHAAAHYAAAVSHTNASADKSQAQTRTLPEWPVDVIYDDSFGQPEIPFECDISAIHPIPIGSGSGGPNSSLNSSLFFEGANEDESEEEYTSLPPDELARMKANARALELATQHRRPHWQMLQQRQQQQHQRQIELQQRQDQQRQLQQKYQRQIQLQQPHPQQHSQDWQGSMAAAEAKLQQQRRQNQLQQQQQHHQQQWVTPMEDEQELDPRYLQVEADDDDVANPLAYEDIQYHLIPDDDMLSRNARLSTIAELSELPSMTTTGRFQTRSEVPSIPSPRPMSATPLSVNIGGSPRHPTRSQPQVSKPIGGMTVASRGLELSDLLVEGDEGQEEERIKQEYLAKLKPTDILGPIHETRDFHVQSLTGGSEPQWRDPVKIQEQQQHTQTPGTQTKSQSDDPCSLDHEHTSKCDEEEFGAEELALKREYDAMMLGSSGSRVNSGSEVDYGDHEQESEMDSEALALKREYEAMIGSGGENQEEKEDDEESEMDSEALALKREYEAMVGGSQGAGESGDEEESEMDSEALALKREYEAMIGSGGENQESEDESEMDSEALALKQEYEAMVGNGTDTDGNRGDEGSESVLDLEQLKQDYEAMFGVKGTDSEQHSSLHDSDSDYYDDSNAVFESEEEDEDEDYVNEEEERLYGLLHVDNGNNMILQGNIPRKPKKLLPLPGSSLPVPNSAAIRAAVVVPMVRSIAPTPLSVIQSPPQVVASPPSRQFSPPVVPATSKSKGLASKSTINNIANNNSILDGLWAPQLENDSVPEESPGAIFAKQVAAELLAEKAAEQMVKPSSRLSLPKTASRLQPPQTTSRLAASQVQSRMQLSQTSRPGPIVTRQVPHTLENDRAPVLAQPSPTARAPILATRVPQTAPVPTSPQAFSSIQRPALSPPQRQQQHQQQQQQRYSRQHEHLREQQEKRPAQESHLSSWREQRNHGQQAASHPEVRYSREHPASPTRSEGRLAWILPMMEESCERLSLIRQEISHLRSEVRQQNLELQRRETERKERKAAALTRSSSASRKAKLTASGSNNNGGDRHGQESVVAESNSRMKNGEEAKSRSRSSSASSTETCVVSKIAPSGLQRGRGIGSSTAVNGATVVKNHSKGASNGQRTRAKRHVCVFVI